MKTYLIYNVIICIVFVAAYSRGYSVSTVFQSTKFVRSGPGGHK